MSQKISAEDNDAVAFDVLNSDESLAYAPVYARG